LVILAKQQVLCWLFWQNSRFFEPFKKKAGMGGSWISGKKFKLKNGGYLNKSDNHILFLNLNFNFIPTCRVYNQPDPQALSTVGS
jgi:hypothetical protein